MSSTLSDWNTKLRLSFDRLHPAVVPTFSNTHTRDILVIIGFLTIILLLFILIIRFIITIRQIYRTSEPKERSKKSYQHSRRFPSYQKLLDADNNKCKCFQYSCLPKYQCIKSTGQIRNSHYYYEQINERKMNNTTYRVITPRSPSCVRVHTVKY